MPIPFYKLCPGRQAPHSVSPDGKAFDYPEWANVFDFVIRLLFTVERLTGVNQARLGDGHSKIAHLESFLLKRVAL
jgi:hypothetical protein